MAARVCHLVNNGTPPERILAITFTRRAATELVSRIASMLGQDCGRRVQALTFHSWCSRLIAADTTRAFTIIDPDDVQDMLSLARGRRDKTFPKSPELASVYSYCRNSGLKLGDYLERYASKWLTFLEDIKAIFYRYESDKRKQNLLDLDDVLAFVAKNLERPEYASAVGNLYDHILVDEMQDTNPLQWRLLSPMIGKSRLFCVGDSAQAIYAFRGSDYRFIHEFTERVPESTRLTLQQNYRSPNACLGISNWLLSGSLIDYGKKLWSENVGDGPTMHIFANQLEEAEWIADKIQEDHTRGIPFASNLILFRSSLYKKMVDAALIKRNIPVTYIGGSTFMKAAHVRDMIAAVRIVHNEDDGIAWIRFLRIFSGIGDEGSSRAFESMSGVQGMEAKLALLRNLDMRFIDPARAMDKILRMTHLHIKDLLGEIVKVLDPQMEKRYREEWRSRRRDIVLLQAIATVEASAASFLENYSLNPLVEYSKRGTETISDKVTLSTIHGAKGVEADIVYVPALMPGHYPPSHARTSEDVEEERRILYVALTRAKRELHLSRPLDRGMVYGRSVGEPSLFFLEGMPQHLVIKTSHIAPMPLMPELRTTGQCEDFGIEM